MIAAIYARKSHRAGRPRRAMLNSLAGRWTLEAQSMREDLKRSYRARAWKEIRSEGPYAWIASPLLGIMAIAHIGEHGWQATLLSVQAAVYLAVVVLLLIYWRLFSISVQVHRFQDTIDQILSNPDAPEDTPALSENAVRRIRHSLQLDT